MPGGGKGGAPIIPGGGNPPGGKGGGPVPDMSQSDIITFLFQTTYHHQGSLQRADLQSREADRNRSHREEAEHPTRARL